MDAQISRKLKLLGMFLFLLGLFTGFLMMNIKNPKMGLAAHMEGVMNGTFLIAVGLIWSELKLINKLKSAAYWTLIYGTFVNWFVTLLSAYFGTSKMTPISGHGFVGTDLQENIVRVGYTTVGLTMLFSVIVMTYGLRGKIQPSTGL
jgi:(hydroxyamino)benzene mutase